MAAPTSVPVTQGSTAAYGSLTQQAGGNGLICTVTFTVVAGGGTGLPADATPQFGTNPLNLTSSDASTTFSVTTTGSTPVGTYTFRVRGTYSEPPGGACQGNQAGTSKDSNLLTLTVQAPVTINTTTVAQDKTVTYGAASVLLTATVTPATGPAVNSGTVTFTVNGSSVTSGPVSAGNASASFSLSGLNAGSYNIAATYNPGSGFNGSNNSGQSPTPKLTVNKATTTTTVTCTGGPFGYTGSAQTPCSATVTGAGGLNQSVPVTYSNNVSAGTATANASFAENTNYLASCDFENFTIGLAELTISAEDQTKTYGDDLRVRHDQPVRLTSAWSAWSTPTRSPA